MKKIKKITLVKLDPSQMQKLMGGYTCFIDTMGIGGPTCGYSNLDLQGPASGGSYSGGGSNGGSGKGGSSGCGCSFCSAEEGGFGFSVGMMIRGRNDMG